VNLKTRLSVLALASLAAIPLAAGCGSTDSKPAFAPSQTPTHEPTVSAVAGKGGATPPAAPVQAPPPVPQQSVRTTSTTYTVQPVPAVGSGSGVTPPPAAVHSPPVTVHAPPVTAVHNPPVTAVHTPPPMPRPPVRTTPTTSFIYCGPVYCPGHIKVPAPNLGSWD
jgi:hypothetical protein